MKIALIIGALETGGAERQALLCAAELTKLGHETCIVIYHPIIEYCDIIEENSINVIEIKSRGAFRSGRIFAMANYLRKGKYDVVHAFSGAASITMALAAKLAGTKVVLGGFRETCTETGRVRFALKSVNRLLAGWIVNSHTIADSMVNTIGINPDKFFILHNGIAPEDFKSTLSKEQSRKKLSIAENLKVVTIVARLHSIKNHRMFLQMASHVPQIHPEAHFLIVGDGPAEKEIKEYAQSIGVDKNVRFLGRRSDIPDILAATDISVLTSDAEGFPNALIEAMSVGKPIVTTDYLGVNELVEDQVNGLIVPRGDVQSFTDAVCQLLDERDLAKKLGNNAKEYVIKNLTPVIMAERLEKIYFRFL